MANLDRRIQALEAQRDQQQEPDADDLAAAERMIAKLEREIAAAGEDADAPETEGQISWSKEFRAVLAEFEEEERQNNARGRLR